MAPLYRVAYNVGVRRVLKDLFIYKEQILIYNVSLPWPKPNSDDAGSVACHPMGLSSPVVTQPGIEPGSVVIRLALRCSALDQCTTQHMRFPLYFIISLDTVPWLVPQTEFKMDFSPIYTQYPNMFLEIYWKLNAQVFTPLSQYMLESTFLLQLCLSG
jgi:hypothetical protein